MPGRRRCRRLPSIRHIGAMTRFRASARRAAAARTAGSSGGGRGVEHDLRLRDDGRIELAVGGADGRLPDHRRAAAVEGDAVAGDGGADARGADELVAGVGRRWRCRRQAFSTVPTAPSVSAKAMIAPPWRMLPAVQRSGRTPSSATTRVGVASTRRTPISPGSSGSRPAAPRGRASRASVRKSRQVRDGATPMTASGSAVAISGTTQIRTTASSISTTNGRTPQMMSDSGMSARMFWMTKMSSPTGGWISPAP